MWTIRRAGPGDRDALAELCLASVGPDDYVPGFLERFIREGVTFLAFDWPYVVGMMVYDDTPDGAAWLHAARTHPDYRGRGVATELNRACERLARERGRSALRLWAAASNAASVRASLRSGFQERARFTRMRALAPAHARKVSLEPLDVDGAWRTLEASALLRAARGYVFHDFYFLPLTRADADRLAAQGALWTFRGNVVAISEDFEDAWGKDLQVQLLQGDADAMLRAAPSIAAARGADRVESFLPHDPAVLEAARSAGFEPMEWGQEAIVFEKPLDRSAGRPKG